MMVPSAAMDRRTTTALAGSPPRLVINTARCSSASAHAVSGTKKEMSSAWVSRMSRTRLPRTARIKMLASRTSALFGIPLLVAARSTNFFVLLHQFVFRDAPRRDHRIQFFRCGAHCFHLGFTAPLLRRDKEAERFSMTRDGQRAPALQITREVLAKLTDANLLGFHTAYPVYTITFRMGRGRRRKASLKHSAARRSAGWA